MLGKAIEPEIAQMIANREFDTLRGTLVQLEVADVAEILDDLPASSRVVVFRTLPRDFATDVFEDLPFEDQEQLVKDLSPEVLTEILNEMAPDDRTHLLEELPGVVTQRLLRSLNPEELRVARTLLGYPEESIGRLMTPEYIRADPDWTVAETLDFVRETGAEAETLNFIYVVDESGRLIDDIYLGRLIMAELDTKLSDLTEESVVVLSAYEDREQAVIEFRKYDRFVLPVTDPTGVLLGIVTVDDVLDVGEQEATEDMQKFAAQVALEDSYLATSTWMLIRKRAGWLTFLFVGGYVTALAMEQYVDLLREFVILAFFIPLVISSGGNSGSQSASLIIRSLAIREVDLGDWRRVMVRELVVGLSLGLFLGTCLAVIILIRGTDHADIPQADLRVAVVAFISVLSIVSMGTLCGALMPFAFKRIGFDPAVSSAPFIATFVDLAGIILYLTLAHWILTV